MKANSEFILLLYQNLIHTTISDALAVLPFSRGLIGISLYPIVYFHISISLLPIARVCGEVLATSHILSRRSHSGDTPTINRWFFRFTISDLKREEKCLRFLGLLTLPTVYSKYPMSTYYVEVH